MRNYISIIFASLLMLVSCTNSDVEIEQRPAGSDKIIISAKSLGITTRSEDTDIESSLALVDVYVMDEAYNVVYSERIDKSASPVVGGGEFTLRKNRDEFTVGEKYFVYMIANSTSPLSTATTWEELCEMTQSDENIHLSGIEGEQNPDYFLMDGFAYLSESGNETAPEAMTAYVINDGQKNKDIYLAGTLYRAAAKIVVTLTQGSSVEFSQEMDGSVPLYSFYQLPISTLVVRPEEGVKYSCQKQTTEEMGLNANTFEWNSGNGSTSLTLIGYAYANDWSKQTANESALLLNIPMMWNKDGSKDGSKESASPVNWYKIPISKENRFERNKCYIINVNINAIGAQEKNTPIEINNAEYVTLDWQKVDVGIGQNEAKYLTLNMEVVKIYNTNLDLDQLTFTSSSPIKSITLKDVYSHNARLDSFQSVDITQESDGITAPVYEEGDGVYAYYIDKFGQKIQLGTDPGFDIKIAEYPELTKEEVLQRELNLYKKEGADVQYIRAVVAPGDERKLNGDIHIYSPINAVAGDADLDWNSHFNTIRYLEFEVMNEQGLIATFRVEQVPHIIISNEEGYFSYRSDQKLTDDQEEASHYHNYMGYKSLHLTGLYFYHEHEWSKEFEMTDEWWAENRNERDYSWVVPQACPANQKAAGVENVHYGNIGNPVTWHNSKGVLQEKVYGGIYRPSTFPTDYFYRWRYNGIGASNNDSQGLSIGGLYTKEVTVDGVTETRWYRKHYVWNIQVVFYNQFVGKVYQENEADKVKGQADIYSMTHATTTYKDDPGTGWGAWGKQRYSNHRMYNIRTTTTKNNYIIGYPSLNSDGTLENAHDNSVMISPNLQVASQLGETHYQSILTNAASYSYPIPVVGGFYEFAKEHCREYVETTFIDENENNVWDENVNGHPEVVIHYDDWRLPTKAEIDQMIELQQSSRAMDRLLVGQYYFCITGNGDDADINDKDNWVSNEVPNYDSGKTGYYIRCVRDVNRKK